MRRSVHSSNRSIPVIQDEEQWQLMEGLKIVTSIVEEQIELASIEIVKLNIIRMIPEFSVQNTLHLSSAIFLDFIHDEPLEPELEDLEQELPIIDQWRRFQTQISHTKKISQSVVTVFEDELEEEFPPPEYEPYVPEIVRVAPEAEDNLYDDQLRNQYAYRAEQREKYEQIQVIREQEKLEEKRKIRNLVNGEPDRVTYDFDGKVILKKDLKHLPAIERKIGHGLKPPTPKMIVVGPPAKKKKLVYKHKIYRIKPMFQDNPDAAKIIAQQEQNTLGDFIESIPIAPGVHLQIGNIEKGLRYLPTQAEQLPPKIQQSIESYLGQESSIRLSKEEYSSITLNGSLAKRKTYNQLHNKTNKTLNPTNNSISVQEEQPKEGVVKVNDIGKFYDLLIKDNEIEEELKDSVEAPETQLLSPHLKFMHPAEILKQVDLPSIPATQFFRYLSNQNNQSQSLSKLEESSISGSVTSKLTRDRSMPNALQNLKSHKFLGAPRIGKVLGYGVNFKYT